MPWYWPFGRDSTISEGNLYDNPTMIEGISDDTILLCIFTISLVALWLYYSTRERNMRIHPDNQRDVELLREQAQQNLETNATQSSRVGRARQDSCPICLTDSSSFTVETNCGHLFCGRCIVTFWKFQANWMTGMNCPICRQQVTVLLTCFTPDEEASLENNDRQMIINDVNDFNRRFSGAPRTYMEYIYDIPVLIPHIFREIFSIRSLAWTYRIRIIIIFFTVIAYIFSPLDILPEGVLGLLGLFDDVFILFCAALYIIVAYREILSRS